MQFIMKEKKNVEAKRGLPVRRTQKGFSLVELMITVAIVVLVTGAVLVRDSGFNETTLLRSQALEMSLDIRTTQQYGVTIRADNPGRSGYGMYFDPQGSPNEYILFFDADDNGLYDIGEELGQRYVLDPRFVITETCVNGNCDSRRKVSVLFRRPNFDAIIGNTNAAGNFYGLNGRTEVEIRIAPVDDTSVTRSVVVYQSGQITVP